MLDEHKALIGKRCAVQYEGERKEGTIVSVVESCKVCKSIILYCVRIAGLKPIAGNDWRGFDTVEVLE